MQNTFGTLVLACTSSVIENRMSNLLQSVLCGLCLVAFPVLRMIPESVLFGLFLYFGVSALADEDLQLAQRWKLLLVEGSSRPSSLEFSKPDGSEVARSTATVTVVQTLALGVIYYISTFAPDLLAVTFPVFTILLFPLRLHLLPCVVDMASLDALDTQKQKQTQKKEQEQEQERCDAGPATDTDAGPSPTAPAASTAPTSPRALVALRHVPISRSSLFNSFLLEETPSVTSTVSTANGGYGRGTIIRPSLLLLPTAAHTGGSVPASAGVHTHSAGSVDEVQVKADTMSAVTFQHQQAKMLLKMRRREGQPDVAGFRFRWGKLNASHPLHDLPRQYVYS